MCVNLLNMYEHRVVTYDTTVPWLLHDVKNSKFVLSKYIFAFMENYDTCLVQWYIRRTVAIRS